MTLLPPRPRHRLAALVVARTVTALALVAPVAAPGLARAQYGYPPPPPPPPPPPGYGYGPYEGPPAPPPWTSAVAFGVDVEGAFPVSVPVSPDGNRMDAGSGFKVRIGDQIRLARGLRVTPEVGYAYDHLFASNSFSDSFAWDLSRLFGGVRVAFGTILVPSIYGHLGIGWRTTGDRFVAESSGLATDAGGALDLRLSRHFQFGAHVEYATLDTTPYAPQWVAAGLHGDMAF